MKKLLVALFVVATVLTLGMTCFAQTYENKDMGISFSISDDWTLDRNQAEMCQFSTDTGSKNEGIIVVGFGNDPLFYDIDWIDNAKFVAAVDYVIDSGLSAVAEEHTSSSYSINEEYADSSYYYYNGVKYFKYDKTVVLSGYGFLDTRFYINTFSTAKNGKIYIFIYMRDYLYNHFSDIQNMINTVSYDLGEVKIRINGERIYPDTSPMIVEGRTLVPIRAVAEKMGYNVTWYGEDQIVSLVSYDGTREILFKIGADTAVINRTVPMNLDVPAVILGGRTYLPLRAATEAMSAQVNWNSAEKTVEIRK